MLTEEIKNLETKLMGSGEVLLSVLRVGDSTMEGQLWQQ